MSKNLIKCTCRGNNENCSFCGGNGYVADEAPHERPAMVRTTAARETAESSAKPTVVTYKLVRETVAKKVPVPKPLKPPKPPLFSDTLIAMTATTVRERKAKTLLKLLHLIGQKPKIGTRRPVSAFRADHQSLMGKFSMAIGLEYSKFLIIFDAVMSAIFNGEIDYAKKTQSLNVAIKPAKSRISFSDVEVSALCLAYQLHLSSKSGPQKSPSDPTNGGRLRKREKRGNILPDRSSKTPMQSVGRKDGNDKPRALNDKGAAPQIAKPVPLQFDALISIRGTLDIDDFDKIRTRIGARDFRFIYAAGSSNGYRKLKAEFPNSSITFVSQQANEQSLRKSSTIEVITVGSPTESKAAR